MGSNRVSLREIVKDGPVGLCKWWNVVVVGEVGFEEK